MAADPGVHPHDAGVGMVEVIVGLMLVTLLMSWAAPAVALRVTLVERTRHLGVQHEWVALTISTAQADATSACVDGGGSRGSGGWADLTDVRGVRVRSEFEPVGGAAGIAAGCASGVVTYEATLTVMDGAGKYADGEVVDRQQVLVFVESP